MIFEQCQYVASLMKGFHKTWFIAGGWAIDLFLDRKTREHQDIEIAMFRNDQIAIKEYLNEWDLKKVIDGTFYSWNNEFLELPIHEIHACHKWNGNRLEVLLNESTEEVWKYRRDMRITYSFQKVWSYSDTGIPYLNPEIVLLYKATNTREKDHLDFIALKDTLEEKKKKWLLEAIHMHKPEHKWIDMLSS